MVTAAALKLTVTTGKFRPKYHPHFPPEQVVTLFRNQVVNIGEISTQVLQMGIACGSATTMAEGTDLFAKKDVDRQFSEIKKSKK
ncbi:hypothetical protein [Sphingobacterium sp. HMA12]|uniref:hypothetical protein n=1 Tax=Sphingobacterium sp. HMA12 TaxID=2050894 RepID=UPI000CEA0902|nr:hypothetical protein [Sphingobacterium sp. HMA12]